MKVNILTKYPTLEVLRLLREQELTIREISNYIKDISRSTLYKHINRMHDEGLIIISKKNIVNGLNQNVYKTNGSNSLITKKDLTDKESLSSFYYRFIYSAINDFEVAKNSLPDEEFLNSTIFLRDVYYMNEQEKLNFYKEIRDVMKKYHKLEKRDDRNLQNFLFFMNRDIRK